MHRYSTAAGGSGVGSSRDNPRSDLTFATARRTVQLTPYKLKCEKEQLNPRLGPPDFYAPAPDCAEECLTRETCQRGYKESIEGIEETRETGLSLAGNSAFWAKENINRYKESLRKRLRAVTNALIRKRKAGQTYNVPLAGNLLAKPGYFPERHTCGEDYRRKWIEDLSQRKRLNLLAEHVPHGFHRKTLFEALIKQKVPFLRATWFIKVSYLNQVRPSSIGNAVGVADKSQAKRLEQWTKDFLEYALSVLDELCISSSSQLNSVEVEPDAHAKWQYVVRLVQWQYAEGLLQQSQVVDWALKQLQEKESLDALELLLPLIMEFMDTLSQSQVYVRVLVVDICLYWLRQLGVTNSLPNAEEQPQQHRVAVMLIELLRYLLVAVPDTFVAFDCFPLLPCVFALNGEAKKEEVTKMTVDKANNNNKTMDSSPYREVFIMEVVDSIQKRASSLTKAVNPGVLRNNEGKVIQELDKSLAAGDILNAYQFVFNIDFSGYEQLPSEWKNANSNLPFLSGMLNNANLSDLFAVRFLCEWAICDFRDTRKPSSYSKTVCIKDLARIYLAASVLSLKRSEIEANSGAKRSKGRATKEKRSAIHDIVVAWIDQHEVRKGEGMQKMQLLLFELVRKGIFHPHAYVRQLIVEGVLERRETPSDIARAARHRRIFRYLPGLPIDSTEDIPEHVRLYRNERRLALQASSDKTRQLRKQGKVKSTKLLEVKQAVCAYFQIPDCTQKVPNAPIKRAAETLGCEDCNRNKRQKTNEGKVYMGIQEAEDTWWLKKIPKVNDTLKLEPTVKPTVRGSRPKTVRKRQSLAQLHNSTRLDTSQGASSSSNPVDTKVHCPYHKPGNKAGSTNEIKMRNDLRNIGLALKQLTVSDKYMFSRWLDRTIRNLFGDGKSVQLSEEQFGAVVYMLDTVLDYYTLVSLLLWLLPLVGIYGRTSVLKDTVGEHAVLSCLRRYELPITSLNLLPEVLNNVMQFASSSGRSLALHYASELFNKYKGLTTIQAWQKTYQKAALELEALKGGDGEGALGFMGPVSEERDDPIPQRLNNRLARIAVSMKDGIIKGLAEASAQIINREREPSSTSTLNFTSKDSTPDKIVTGCLDSIKQSGNPQTDFGLLNAAVTAIVSSAMSNSINAYDQLTGASNISGIGLADSPALRCVRRILQLHTRCLRLLKEGLDDRQSRLLELSLTTEASASVSGQFVHNRPARSQFHLSPETPELGVFAENLTSNQSSMASSTRLASASALLIMSVLYGVVGLERLVSLLKIKDGLEQLHLPKLLLYGSNGNLSRSSNMKQDSLLEGYIHWFRALLGDCRGVAGGLLADFLGEANVYALFRTQRLLSLSTVFPPAYAMFCGLLRRQVLSRLSILSREEGILHSLACAVSDMVKHEPFREVCLQDTRALHGMFSQDVGAAEYAGLLDEQGLDVRMKIEAMLPFSARLFLHALLDGVAVTSMEAEDAWMEDVKSNRQVEQMVHILDELQPATFHWQWLELRLLLNEQVFVEKIDASSAVKAMQASVGGTEQLSECEKSFTEKVLTGLLYRPDAGALYSEVLHCLGKPLEEYLIKLVTWTLQGHDLLFARKSLRQKLDKGFPKGTSNLKTWGWQPPGSAGDVEEGEVSTQERCFSREEGTCLSQHFATEKALADLVLPCLARSPNDTCTGFASNLVQQMAELEQQVTSLTRSNGRLSTVSTTQVDGLTKSQASRRGARGGLEAGSPGVRRRPTIESSPVSPAALQSSMWLRLQFLLPLLRIVYSDRDANSAKNMRITLASVLLRLLGTRIVQESAESFGIIQDQSNREGQWNAELASAAAAAAAGEELFDRLLSVLHALLSNTWAVWLKPRGRAAKSPREVPPFDRDAADRMQTELDHMQLPRSLRTRLQAAMPVFPPGPVFAVSAAPPQVPPAPFSTLTSQKPLPTDLKTSSMDTETGMDPWLLLEDGTGVPGSVGTSGAGGDGGPLRACPWLKGAVRVRRTDLTYAASVDSTDT